MERLTTADLGTLEQIAVDDQSLDNVRAVARAYEFVLTDLDKQGKAQEAQHLYEAYKQWTDLEDELVKAGESK